MMCDPAILSREFRALVTSIRGPLEDELAEGGVSEVRRERLKTLHRNFMRLLQLVNMLFDASTSDAGRRAGGKLVDLAATTVVIPTLRDGDLPPPRDAELRDPHDGAACATELERVNQALAVFSYSISHDLRGPLRAMDGFSQVLLSDHAHALDGNGRELVEQIHASAERMNAIIDDLLDPSQAGKGEPR